MLRSIIRQIILGPLCDIGEAERLLFARCLALNQRQSGSFACIRQPPQSNTATHPDKLIQLSWPGCQHLVCGKQHGRWTARLIELRARVDSRRPAVSVRMLRVQSGIGAR